MKKRIIEIIKELKEVIQEECLSISHDTLFKESVSCYRGEQAGKPKGNYKSKPATDKQIAYAQQLADKKKIELKITGKETSQEISKLIEELKK